MSLTSDLIESITNLASVTSIKNPQKKFITDNLNTIINHVNNDEKVHLTSVLQIVSHSIITFKDKRILKKITPSVIHIINKYSYIWNDKADGSESETETQDNDEIDVDDYDSADVAHLLVNLRKQGKIGLIDGKMQLIQPGTNPGQDQCVIC